MSEEIIRVSGKPPIHELYNEFSISPPEGFEGMSDEQMLVMKGLVGGVAIGMIAGYAPVDAGFIRIHILYLEPKHRNVANIRKMLEAMVLEAKKNSSLSHILWRYRTTKDDVKDPHYMVCRGIKEADSKVENLFYHFELDLKNMLKVQPKFKDYGEDLLQRKKLELIRCVSADEERRKEMERILNDADEEIRSLEPYDGSNQDEENSVFLIDKASDEIRGWMICRNLGGGFVEVARFYVLPKWRNDMTGIYFGGHMLRRLAGRYDAARMKALIGNRPVLAFLRGFFSESIKEDSERIITMKWKENRA